MGRKKSLANDKYYQLAKEQGYRARSSFKLIQLNRKYDFLKGASRVIDLCAAPGGWLQVLEKTMPKTADRQIVGVDLLPIKPIRGCTTFVEDITSETCRQKIRKEMRGNKADVVLCDGAPNVGAEYSKDAFVQNELAVYALKFACEHLKRGGSFCTKVFRSNDYTALLWAFQQLFKKVEATKPPSSRNVSAEIFVVCREYLAPHKIDPRLLDPRHVLSQVEKEEELTEQQAINKLFHKRDKQRRNRGGYSEDAGALVFKSAAAADFVNSSEPVQALASLTEINFKDEASKALLERPETTREIVEYLSDLKVLGKAELRTVLKWRSALRNNDMAENKAKMDEDSDDEDEEEDDEEDGEAEQEGKADSDADDSDVEDMADLDDAMKKIKAEELKKRKREIKKLRKQRAKLQRRIDLGMENEFAVDLSEQQGPFSLKETGLRSMQELAEIQDGAYSKPDPDDDSSDEDDDFSSDGEDDEDGSHLVLSEEQRRLRQLEREAEALYKLNRVKGNNADPMTVRERRQQLAAEKKAKVKKKTLEAMAERDFSRALEEEQAKAAKSGQYEAMLQGAEDDSDSSDDDDDDEVEAELANPLIKSIGTKPSQAARAKLWFEQELFDGEREALSSDEDDGEEEEGEEMDDEEEEEEEEDEEDEDSVDMPLPSSRTEKARRKEKRRKLKIRNERKAEKRRIAAAREADGVVNEELLLASMPGGFETVKAETARKGGKKRQREDSEGAGADPDGVALNGDEDEDGDDEATREKKRAARAARKLIEKGMGKLGKVDEPSGFEVVAAEPVGGDESDLDDDDEEEAYNSEDYDTDERSQHIALASMMTKSSKRRKLLDSGYNRFAFNDDDALPQWFIEDENKHNRPQLPVTKEMVDAVRARYKDIAAKPINKVAEARARKKHKLMAKIDKIKKKAAAVAEQPDLTPGSKMRAIEKLYKGSQVKKPGSVYVVARKSNHGKVNVGGKHKGKTVKVVDRRMKADQARSKGRGKPRGGSKGGKKSKSRR
ncbi:AdoMet-dependent rRNA methyltransferase spb1 [Hondaea fermentalgiana]|uniref:Putative rRNA methyltransferase n=1 Tax=Hondaea fermentalgiana TaxID=2315210 RepID=A0A2R5GP69_9STRA|nr:AdoMet-dependent rRNA methyltransferase spb1 [Hondaea fermentalgiana]|eukprot:GBG32672.1 AdoMet-dependent rRNA methyltransferase spb1 [Hondaea fermentalgiana]